jgi:hypothetical protein
MLCHFFRKLWDFETCSMWWTLAWWITIPFEEIVEFSIGVFLKLLCAFNLWFYCFGCNKKIKTMVMIDLEHSEQGVEVISSSPFMSSNLGFFHSVFYLMFMFWVSSFFCFFVTLDFCVLHQVFIVYIESLVSTCVMGFWFLCFTPRFCCLHWVFGF